MGKRGVPKGYKYKPDAETVRNRIWAMVTDEQYEFLEAMVMENDITFSHAVRICLDVVADLPLSEYQAKIKKYLWKE